MYGSTSVHSATVEAPVAPKVEPAAPAPPPLAAAPAPAATSSSDRVVKAPIVGTIVQDPFGFGYEAVKAMAALAKGQTDSGPAVRAVPHRIVTKAGGPGRMTVQEYRIQERMKVGKGAR